MYYDLGGTRRGFYGTTCFHFGQQGQAASKSSNRAGKGPMDPLQSRGCDLGARGCHKGSIPSTRTMHCLRGRGCNTPVVKPQTYDPSCDLCSFALWTYDILYDRGIILFCVINLIKDLLLMDFGTTINVNVISSIYALFECC